MGRIEDFRQYAADCVRQAEGEQRPEDKTILLNMALAWIRLAQQSQAARAASTDESGPPPPKQSAVQGERPAPPS